MKKLILTAISASALVLAPLAAQANGRYDHDTHQKSRYDRSHERRDHGNHRDRNDRKVVVVKNNHWRYTPPHHYYRAPPRQVFYYRSSLPELATFAILAGVTYAIIDNHYYRQTPVGYQYVANPPVHAAPVGGVGLMPGTVVDVISGPVRKVAYQGRLYYVANQVWYLPVDGGRQFVVVTPRY